MSTVTDLESRIAILEQQLADLNDLLGRMAPAAQPLADTDELLSQQPVLAEALDIGDLFYVVDVSDVTDGAWGSSKQTDGNRIAEFVGLQGYIKDAPSDGSQYARQDAGWSVVDAGTSIGGNANTVVIADGLGGAAGNSDISYSVGNLEVNRPGAGAELSLLGNDGARISRINVSRVGSKFELLRYLGSDGSARWQADTVQFKTNAGNAEALFCSVNGSVGFAKTTGINAQIDVSNTINTQPASIFRGTVGQTANLTEWNTESETNWADGTRARVNSDGAFSDNSGFGNAEKFGQDASCTADYGTALGKNAIADFAALAVGRATKASSSNAIAIGNAAEGTATGAFALGATSAARFDYSIALGYSSSTTGVNQCVIGGVNQGISNVYVGRGASNSADITGTGCTIHASGTSHATGDAGDLRLVGGTLDGTGQSGAEGNVVLGHDGTAKVGEVVCPSLPTSAAGLPSGALWNNAGVVNVAP